MKKLRFLGLPAKAAIFVAAALALSLAFLGCDNLTTATDSFVPVTGITGVPESGTMGTPLVLRGTVNPAPATNQPIVWSVRATGTTAEGAAITGGNSLSVSGA